MDKLCKDAGSHPSDGRQGGGHGPILILRFFRSTMMSLLDTLASMAGGGQQGGSASLLPALIEQLNKYPGGLSGLIASFQKGGLSEIVASWVGTGQNMPVSADQLGSVLDPGVVNELAAKTGQDTDSVLGSLSSLLPQLVDQATPNGEVQGGQQFNPAELLASLSGIFGNRAG
ncbi:YidB family protein [Achromobacter insolitus]|uniref:YidB family protein n=2 Tax=Alcaligenaceae TaxID=506 RepID=UPI0025B71C1C|nr:YidB family protein [Achromobacter insolitus]